MSVLGIDFGTSYTSASRINGHGLAEAVTFAGHDCKMPSLALFYRQPPLIGFEAQSMYEEGMKGLPRQEQVKLVSTLVKSIKTRLEPQARVFGLSHADIVAMILAKAKAEAEVACAPNLFNDLVLTHPVQFEEWKKELLTESAHKAGFAKVTLMHEPVAAAIGYINRENLNDTRGIIVYDFGAGTFDVAYVMKRNGKFTVPLTPKGDSRCGGDDIDDALYHHLTQMYGCDEELKSIDLLWQCRRWKELLSTLDSVPVAFSAGDTTHRTTITRETFNDLAGPIIDKTIKLTSELYDEVRENNLPVDFILMIGGSSNIPAIRERISEYLPGVEIRTSGINDIAVALGASCHPATEIEYGDLNEYCYCVHDGRRIRKDYKYCIYCGKPNYYHTLKKCAP